MSSAAVMIGALRVNIGGLLEVAEVVFMRLTFNFEASR